MVYRLIGSLSIVLQSHKMLFERSSNGVSSDQVIYTDINTSNE